MSEYSVTPGSTSLGTDAGIKPLRATPCGFIGFDPSLTNWGVAVFDRNLSLIDYAVIETEPDKRKAARRVDCDDMRRAGIFVQHFYEMLQWRSGVTIASEVPSGSQSARAAIANGIVYGILAWLQCALPVTLNGKFVPVAPDEIKAVVSARRGPAGKLSSVEWAMSMGFDLSPLGAKAHHVADAIAAVAVVRPDHAQIWRAGR